VLVHGTAAAYWSFRFLTPLLANEFTLYAVDRRGRGESGDDPEYDLEREFEDVAAVVDSVGGAVSIFGHSYGATVALGASLLTRNARRLVLYEPAPGVPVVSDDDLARIDALVSRGERDDALVAAFRAFGVASEEVEQLRASPTWGLRVELVQTVTREVRAEMAWRVGPERLRDVTAPVLLLIGELSPPWAREPTERIRAAVRDGRVTTLDGEGHVAIVTAPELVAREVTNFLRD
jgi:pimeloyl-ACP methyl ester carboxylesterase